MNQDLTIEQQLHQHSLTLQGKIREQIAQNGSISFAQFMQMALYYPGLGYYSSGMKKFGKEGDFITSPELGSLFAQCMAKQFQQVLTTLDHSIILELGAGTGQFCFDCLIELDNQNCLPNKYYILEISADLKQRQKLKIAQLPTHLSQLVEWINQPLETSFSGVIFANEVLDALPVEVFEFNQNKFKQKRIEWEDGFKETWQDFSINLNQQLVDKELMLENGFQSEFIPNLTNWLASITENFEQGLVLFVDYGYERQAYYHSQRNQGTLVCHHQHQANFNYYTNLGLQDITAFVDFTAVAEAADQSDFKIDGFTTQAHLLLSLGVQDLLGDTENEYSKYYEKANEMKKLVMPEEMGEKFKAIALTKNLDTELIGFKFNNQLHLL
jgi:SAM-dependent MidA family methyltransferase